MSQVEGQPVDGAEAWERFQKLGRKVLAVPAEEMKRRDEAYRAEGKHAPRKPGRPKGAKPQAL